MRVEVQKDLSVHYVLLMYYFVWRNDIATSSVTHKMNEVRNLIVIILGFEMRCYEDENICIVTSEYFGMSHKVYLEWYWEFDILSVEL